jgi:hypothetical protein
VADKWRIAQVAHAGNNIRGKVSLVSGKESGLHREKKKKTETAMWSPLCVFGNDEDGSSVYMSYDVKSNPKKKAPVVKKLAGSVKSARPGSAASTSRRGVNPGSARSRDLLASATRKSNQSLVDKEAPKERGLNGKTKGRYA